MATLAQYNTALQPVRNLNIKINILDYNMQIVDEISGVTKSANISIDADADVRRTATISMIIHADYMPTGIQSIDIGTIWQSGSPYWFDKYIQIYIGIEDMLTQEVAWVNQGIYLINTPSISYDATTSELSFSGVDLMAKLTGIRNGHLEGMTYQVNAGDSIVGAMRAILEEQGFTNAIIKEPPIEYVPNDISVDVGGTAYDVLSQLRDINPNWEMFFDVDGVFYFQPIPQATPTESPLVDVGVWDELATGHGLDTSFEDVKNYVEVVGKTIEVDETVTPIINGNTISITLSKPFASYYSASTDVPITWRFGFTLGSLSSTPTLLTNDLFNLTITDSASVSKSFVQPKGYGVWYNNQQYFVAMTASDDNIESAEVGGYTQIRAIAFEDNAESPFYVGDVISGPLATKVGGNASWGNELGILTSVKPSAYSTDVITGLSTASLNISPWVDFTNAPISSGKWVSTTAYVTDNIVRYNNTWWRAKRNNSNKEPMIGDDWEIATNLPAWKFYIDVSAQTGKTNVLNVTAQGYTSASLSLTNDEATPANVSIDYNDGTYAIEFIKTGASTMTATLYYISIPASNWETPTTKIYSLPKFSKMVRGVCSGDEYDNIYTNDLAQQRAKYEIYLKARLHDTLNITCVPLYWLDVNTLISYKLHNDDESTLWLVKSISTDLSESGTQSISAIRFYPLYQESQIDWSRKKFLVDSNGDYIIDFNENYLIVSDS